MKIRWLINLALSSVFILLAGCVSLLSTPTPTPTSTPTASPTSTSTPTLTQTPTPTNTPTPTPIPIPEEFNLLPEWRVGDTYTYDSSYTLQQNIFGESLDPTVMNVPVFLSVLDKYPDGYLLEWRYGELDMDQFNQLSGQPEAAAYLSLMQSIFNLRTEYKVDLLGQVIGLQNRDEILLDQQQFMEQYEAFIAEPSFDPDLAVFLANFIAPNLAEDRIEDLALTDAQNFHSLYGLRFNTQAPISLKKEIPNSLGPINFDFKFRVLEYDLENDRVRLAATGEANRVQFARLFREYLQKTLAGIGQSGGIVLQDTDQDEFDSWVDLMLEDINFEMEILASAQLSSGWITEYELKQRIDFWMGSTESTLTLNRLED